MQSQFVATNHINLHVMTDGPENGTPVVLLHGFPEFHYGWRSQIPALAEAGFRVIIPDQRGYNLSDKPKGVSAYDVDILAKDIIGLFDHFGIQKVKLVGHDWGAVVAWTVAINHPERLEKLMIMNVPHPDVMTDFILHNTVQRKRSWYVYFFQIPFFVEWMLGKNNYEYLARMLVQSGRKNTFSESDVMEYIKAWSQKGALTGMVNWYRAAMRRGLRSAFGRKLPARRVHVPVMMLWGIRDMALSHEMAQPSIDLCDSGELTFFNRATHWVQHDAPKEVNRKLIEFMR
ncbi:MAG: alpha/beta hydrolase [Chloroflexi bacterium]|nr:alpha/beta hydrolase [Chloroflexota bacterium]